MAAVTSPDPLPLPVAALLVAAGGTVGVLARALLTQPVAPGAWPWRTFVVNVVGSLLLGALLAVLQRGPDVGRRRAVRLGVGTGVLGGFTTYSTFALEVEQLVATGHVVTGVAYALGSIVLGVVAAGAGLLLVGRALAGRSPGDDAAAGAS